MNVTVKAADLVRELTPLEKIVAKKVAIPILANVLVTSNGDGAVSVKATDTELGLTSACPATIAAPGQITLPAKRLLDLSRAQSDAQITLQADANGVVKFTSGKFSSRLQSLTAEDFPKMAEPEGTAVELPRKPFRQALQQVRFAISEKGSGRYFINGALLDLKEGSATLVATDTSRLALSKIARVGTDAETILLPVRLIDQMLALFDEGDAPVQFSHTAQHLFFVIDHRVLYSRQIEGQFPAYDRVIPKQNTSIVPINRAEWSAVLKRQILIDEIVHLTLANQLLGMQTKHADIGEGLEQLAVNYTGPSVSLILRGASVLDFLDAATSETITLAVGNDMTPVLLQDGDYVNVIMPMRV